MLYKKLIEYSKSSVYPFHMPGHKRFDINGDGKLPYKLDLTEIYGFDDLHNANGCIRDIGDTAAQIYNVDHALLLINGATGGILSAVRSMTKRGDRVLIARNCHKSVYNAAELMGLKPEYILPGQTGFGLFGSVSPGEVEKKLTEFKDIKLVIITSPTYEGVCSDIGKISEICHAHNAMLFVDEAHGAHFPFNEAFPVPAVHQGADAAVISLHKTLPSLTQTALLLTNNNTLAEKFSLNTAVFETSSPSYILMSSIECCLSYLKNSRTAFDEYIDNLTLFYKRTKTLKHLSLFDCDNRDIGKLVILTDKTNLSGHQLAGILRKEYQLETEMSSADYVIAMTSVCDTAEGFERLNKALSEIDNNCFTAERKSNRLNVELPPRSFFPCEKDGYKAVKKTIDKAVGCVSLEYIFAYPPGIPLIVPGEVLTEKICDCINYQIRNGVEMISSEKNMPHCLSVAEL